MNCSAIQPPHKWTNLSISIMVSMTFALLVYSKHLIISLIFNSHYSILLKEVEEQLLVQIAVEWGRGVVDMTVDDFRGREGGQIS